MSKLASTLPPSLSSDMARVSLLETSHYMRNQLLRDCDWAGMAHSVEIRTPFADVELIKRLAPILSRQEVGRGKKLLASTPKQSLPDEVINKAKTGFSVPTSDWLLEFSAGQQKAISKGSASRGWARVISTKAPGLRRPGVSNERVDQ